MAGYTACSDDQTLVAVLNTIGHTSSTVNTGWVNMGANVKAQFIINVGAIGAAEAMTAVASQATSSTGAGAKATNNAIAITAITASNTSAVVNINGQSMDANNGFQWVSLNLGFVTSGTTAALGTFATVNVLAVPDVTPPTSVASQVIGAGISADY